MKAIWMAVAVALSLSSVACGGTVASCKKLCKKGADCSKDDLAYIEDEDACKDDCDDAEVDDDCKSEGKKLAKCLAKNFECDGSGGEECTSEFDDAVDCATE